MTNVHYPYFLSPTGPSNQTTVGPNRVVYNSQVVFPSNGSFRQTVYAPIINDEIGLEDDEIVHLELISNSTNLSYFSTTMVRVIDDECKPCIL